VNIAKAKEILGNEFAFMARDTDKIVQQLNLPTKAEVLDIGTGTGSMAIILALNGHHVLTGEPEDDDSSYAGLNWLENARKVEIDPLITFKAFNAREMPFEDDTFDGIFSLGAFHHIEEDHRTRALQECIRTSKAEAPICLFEPNQNCITFIKKRDPTHPDVTDPSEYIQDLDLGCRKIPGTLFDAFIFRK
jgi:ubiquinone/menaquinone biosynthesis C-methylase UbiE